MLNGDYRLFTTIMARRMENILARIIDLDQTGFIKHRQTFNNIHRTLHIMQHIQNNITEALIMGMYAEKAFDSVRFETVFRTMTKFNSQQKYINII